MRTYPECYGCVLQQAQSEMDLMGVDFDTQVTAVKKMLSILSEAEGSETPPYLSDRIHTVLRDIPGYSSPYAEVKRKSNQIALEFLDKLRDLAKKGSDPLVQGLKIGAAGNIVDVLNAREFHLWEEVEKVIRQDLLGGGLENFRRMLSESSYLLYLADNAGETVFDRIFIETLDLPVIYAVKGGPILNDATLDDALAAGIDQVAEIVETGSSAPGTILKLCSREFQDLFIDAPLVLAKGQANFETIEIPGEKVFYLLRAKCPLIARVIESPHGSLVLKQNSPID
ncbi:MAG: hypothetical protein DRI65_04530 [Chloroflexota bacterium]|nr:MAG: hypothetical protein DRI65_04530 [Chloroflexota bacterium]